MYQNKLTASSMSSYSFSSFTFFHEISCSTYHKFVLSQQDYRMGPCKNKNNTKCKYLKICRVQNNYSSPNSNFKLVQYILSIKNRLKLIYITQYKYPHVNSHSANFPINHQNTSTINQI